MRSRAGWPQTGGPSMGNRQTECGRSPSGSCNASQPTAQWLRALTKAELCERHLHCQAQPSEPNPSFSFVHFEVKRVSLLPSPKTNNTHAIQVADMDFHLPQHLRFRRSRRLRGIQEGTWTTEEEAYWLTWRCRMEEAHRYRQHKENTVDLSSPRKALRTWHVWTSSKTAPGPR